MDTNKKQKIKGEENYWGRPAQFNGAAFGMVCKIVAESLTVSWCLANPASFKEHVRALYDLTQELRKDMETRSP